MPEHVSGNPQNNRPVKERRSRSTFDLSHYIFGTHRFGQYNLNFFQDCVGGDKIPVRSSDVIDSYTLKAPLMQDVQKTKEYFYVPKQCILPINWDKIERLPALGDDINASLVNSTIVDFFKSSAPYYNFFSSILGFEIYYEDDQPLSSKSDALAYLSAFFKKLLFLELWFSNGSLLSASGIHLSELVSYFLPGDDYISGKKYNFDEYFDYFVRNLFSASGLGVLDVKFGAETYYSFNPKSSNYISIHRFLELARDDYNFVFNSSSLSEASFISAVVDECFAASDEISTSGSGVEVAFSQKADVNFTIDRCAAYQIVCAHYFSNDSIDFIHSADLWRQNMFALYKKLVVDQEDEVFSFSYNGVSTLYDTLSNYVLKYLFSSALGYFSFISDEGSYTTFCFNSPSVVGGFGYFLGFFINLLGWRRSLRYQDYFTGSKARPLAVGDFSIAVNAGKVDVVDVTKKISLQRLANNVNRIGNSIQKWYEEIMGSELNYDYHNPMWLASTRSTVYAAKSENTAQAQQEKAVSTVANFVGKDSNFEFTMRPDRNGVIIGITYYDIRRAYYTGIDRMAQHIDRFDGFIPDMQFIGDQPVNKSELSLSRSASGTLGYQMRNAEYKQRYDLCYGGFVDKLPGFAFLYRPETVDEGGIFHNIDTISPEFIRSHCDEFDEFYISLSGYSLAHYFHFIVKTYNEVKASRPMIFAPQIL